MFTSGVRQRLGVERFGRLGRVSDRSEAFGSSDGRTGRLNVDIVSRTPCIDITLSQSGRLLTLARGIHHFMTDSELLMYVSGADGRLMVNAMSRGDRVLRLRLTLCVSIPTINNLFRRAVYTHPGTRKIKISSANWGLRKFWQGIPQPSRKRRGVTGFRTLGNQYPGNGSSAHGPLSSGPAGVCRRAGSKCGHKGRSYRIT